MSNPTFLAPNTSNLRVGRGFLSGKPWTGSAFVHSGLTDFGSCIVAEISWNITKLDHFSPRQGIQVKDQVAQTRVGGLLEFTLEEQTGFNLANWHQGQLLESGSDKIFFLEQVLTSPLFYSIVFTDTSSYGPTWEYVFPKVLLTPKTNAKLGLISAGSGDWSNMQFDADVLDDTPTSVALGLVHCLGWLDNPSAGP